LPDTQYEKDIDRYHLLERLAETLKIWRFIEPERAPRLVRCALAEIRS
jgi:hypothetical protein